MMHEQLSMISTKATRYSMHLNISILQPLQMRRKKVRYSYFDLDLWHLEHLLAHLPPPATTCTSPTHQPALSQNLYENDEGLTLWMYERSLTIPGPFGPTLS
jgi:hypothetical protein